MEISTKVSDLQADDSSSLSLHSRRFQVAFKCIIIGCPKFLIPEEIRIRQSGANWRCRDDGDVRRDETCGITGDLLDIGRTKLASPRKNGIRLIGDSIETIMDFVLHQGEGTGRSDDLHVLPKTSGVEFHAILSIIPRCRIAHNNHFSRMPFRTSPPILFNKSVRLCNHIGDRSNPAVHMEKFVDRLMTRADVNRDLRFRIFSLEDTWWPADGIRQMEGEIRSRMVERIMECHKK